MKIFSEEKKFVPITIVLETQEEAEGLYGLVNAAEGRTLIEYYRGDSKLRVTINGVKNKIFDFLVKELNKDTK